MGASQSTHRCRHKRTVITIHGVNPKREWQDSVHRVLAPFFQCKRYDYHEYDSVLGPLKAIANIQCLVIALLLLLVTLGSLYIPGSWPSIAAFLFLATAISFVVSLVLAWRLRTSCADRLMLGIDARQKPHVIAHSLGTYLIGVALKKFPSIRLSNVVLVSTVLPRNFPWSRILTRDPGCIRNVRSEFGKADVVVRIVGWLTWLIPDLGNAGLYGFRYHQKWVHTSSSLTKQCSTCKKVPVPVHNFPLHGFEHSTHFLGTHHAKMIWLPFLWDLAVDEFNEYCDTCNNAVRFEENKQYNEASEIISKLWEKRFNWTSGKSLNDFARAEITANIARRPGFPANIQIIEILKEVRNGVHIVAVLAEGECSREGNADEEIARLLDPRLAVCEVVDSIIKEYQDERIARR
jgi:pimeloyl-ACP methyl ester carboxylesterase